LGVSLFSRSRDGLLPTEHALSLITDARAMQSASFSLQRRGGESGGRIAGTVRISASEIVGTQFLPDILSSLQREKPLIRIELALSNAQDNLLNRDADIAVRLLRPVQQQLLAQKVGVLKLGLYAHQSYLEGSPPPKTVDELSKHRLIGFDRDPGQWAKVRIGERSAIQFERSFLCDSDIGQLAALQAGLGIGVCSTKVAQRDHNLVPVLRSQLNLEYEIWIAMHEDLKHDLAVREAQTHLAVGLRKALH